MSIFITTKRTLTSMTPAGPHTSPLQYHVRGEKIRWRWWWKKLFGMLIHFKDDATGVDVYVRGGECVTFQPLSKADLEAAKARAEAQADKPLIEPAYQKPTYKFPHKRTN